MKHLLADLTEFHRACDQPVFDTPTVPADERIVLRIRLLEEEHRETACALRNLRFCLAKGLQTDLDLQLLADGLADLIYVAVGTALEFGIPLDRVWDAVHASNMSKVSPCVKREDGKILKGPNYHEPRIREALWGEP
jgi:predicted HAD superfamily Cof-like phosphohydrolase